MLETDSEAICYRTFVFPFCLAFLSPVGPGHGRCVGGKGLCGRLIREPPCPATECRESHRISPASKRPREPLGVLSKDARGACHTHDDLSVETAEEDLWPTYVDLVILREQLSTAQTCQVSGLKPRSLNPSRTAAPSRSFASLSRERP